MIAQNQVDSIKTLVHKVDSLRFNGLAEKKEEHWNGGSRTTYTSNDSLVYLHHVGGEELYTRITVVHFHNDHPIQINFYEQIPNWDTYREDPKNDSITDWAEAFDRMTYTDKAVVFYISKDDVFMFNSNKGQEAIAPNVDWELYEKLQNEIKTVLLDEPTEEQKQIRNLIKR